MRPIRGQGGRCETSKPVAQTIASKGWRVASSVRMPVGSMRRIGEVIRLTLSRVKAEVAWSRSGPAAAYLPLRCEFLGEVFVVVEALLHHGGGVFAGEGLGFGVLDEHVEGSVAAGLDLFAVLVQGFWVFSEMLFLFLGVDVLRFAADHG